MPEAAFTSAAIAGVVTCVPRDERRIDDEVALFGGNLAQIKRIKATIGLDRQTDDVWSAPAAIAWDYRTRAKQRYRLTSFGLKAALFYARTYQRLLRPGFSVLTDAARLVASSPPATAV